LCRVVVLLGWSKLRFLDRMLKGYPKALKKSSPHRQILILLTQGKQSSPLFCLLLQRMLISWRLSSMKETLRPILFKSRRKILALSFVLWIINEFGLKYRRFSEIWVDIESTSRVLSLNFYAKFSSPKKSSPAFIFESREGEKSSPLSWLLLISTIWKIWVAIESTL